MVESSNESLKIAVVSDLHAYVGESGTTGEPPSHLSTSSPEDQPNLHPIGGLLKLIADEALSAEVLICCGDIGDKAHPSAIKFGWERIHRIKSALHAKTVIAAPGNHDLDSRHNWNEFDAKGFLQSLIPEFPFSGSTLNDAFWSRNFVVTELEGCRFLVINSSAYHGANENEILHGRVATRTIEAIRLALQSKEWSGLNIAVCHHHPLRYDDIVVQDYSEMQGGGNLLNLLGSGQFGRWLIVHGHKHQPHLSYAPGSASAPVIFSAGSLCAYLYGQIQNRVRNQFYVIEFPRSRFDELRLELAGQFFAWDWISAKGWQRATPASGLPAFGGFGYRPEIKYDAREIAGVVKSAPPYMNWSEIIDRFPKFDYMIPADLYSLEEELKLRHKLALLRTPDGTIVQIAPS